MKVRSKNEVPILQGFLSTPDASAEIESLVRTVGKHSDDFLLVLVGFDGVLAEHHDDPESCFQISAPRRQPLFAAVRDFLEEREGRRVFAVYIGEDVSEDDAYEAFSGHGVAAVVGARAAQVDHHLPLIEMVDLLLAQLAALREAGETRGRS